MRALGSAMRSGQTGMLLLALLASLVARADGGVWKWLPEQQLEGGLSVDSMCRQPPSSEETLAEDWTAAFEAARAEWESKRDADQVQLVESLAQAYATLGARPAWWQHFLHMPWAEVPEALALERAHSALRNVVEQVNAGAFMGGASQAYKDEILEALALQLKAIESLSGGSYTRAWQLAWGESPHEGIARLQSKVSSWDAGFAVDDVTQVARIEKVVATDLQEGVVGQPLALPVTVRVSTFSGEPVVGATVTFKRAGDAHLMFLPHPGPGGGQSELQAITDEHGHASVRVVPDANIERSRIQRMGTYAAQYLGYNLVAAETSNGTQVFGLIQPFALVGLPDVPANLLPNFDNTPTEPGLQMMGSLNVRVVDQYGNNLANEPVVWTQLDPTGRFFASSMVDTPQVLDYSNPLQLMTITGWSRTSGYQAVDYIPGPTSGTYRVTAALGSLIQDFDVSATASRNTYVLRAPSYEPYATVYGLHSSRVSKIQILRWPQGATGWTPLNGNEQGLLAAEVKIDTYAGYGPGGSSSNLLDSYVEEPVLIGVEPLDDAMSVVHRVKALVAPSAGNPQPYQNYLLSCRVYVEGRVNPVSCHRGMYNPSRSVVPSLRLIRRLPDGRVVSSEGDADASDQAVGFTVANSSSDKLYVRMIVQPNEPGDAIVTGFEQLPLDSDGDAEIQSTAGVSHLLSLNSSTRGGGVRFELYAKDHGPTSVTKVLQAVREFEVTAQEPELVLRGLPLVARWVLPAWDFVSARNPVPGQPPPEDAQVPVAYSAQLVVLVNSDGILRVLRGGDEISRAAVQVNATSAVTQVTPISGLPIVVEWNGYAVVDLSPGAAGVETIGISFTPANANAQTVTREVPLKTSVMSEGRLSVGHTFIKGVSLVDGHLVKQAVDLESPSRGLGLTWSRTYASGESENGVLGLGWTHAYNGVVRPLGDFRFLVTSGEGGGQVFKCTGDGTGCVPQPGYHGTFRAEGTGTERAYVFRAKSGVEYRYGLLDTFSFPLKYRLTSVVAPTGHSLMLSYNNIAEENTLSRVFDLASGRSLWFGYGLHGGRQQLVAVELHHSRTPDAAEETFLEAVVSYDYDEQGRLVSVSRYDEGNLVRTESFAYEEGASEAGRTRMSRYTGPNGEVTRYTYYSSTDVLAGEDQYLLLMNKDERVKEVIEVLETLPVREGITTFAYSIAPEPRTILGEALTVYTTTVHGPRPGVPASSYRMNATGAVVETVRPLTTGVFATSSALWNATHRARETEADERGRVTNFVYDEFGNLTERRIGGTALPGSGLVAPTLQVLDAQGLPVEEIVEKWGYDPGFNVQVCHVDAEGFATVSRIDSIGDSPEQVVPVGTGRVLETRRYANRVSRPALTSTAPCDEVVASLATSPQDVVLSWRYCGIEGADCPPNALPGDLAATVGADGHEEQVTEYDMYGQLRSKTLQVSDTSVITVQSTFDARGRLEVEQDGLGRHRTLQWDALDRLTQEDQWNFGEPGVSRTVQYYAGGQLKREEQGVDFVRDYYLDAAGRLARIVESGGGLAAPLETRYGYDEAGNRTTVIDRRGVLTTTAYDFADRPVEVKVSVADGPRFISQGGSPDEVGRSYVLSTTRYDDAGNKVWHADLSGFDRTYRLDSFYRVVEEHSPEVPGASDTAQPLRYIQESRYDLVGRKVREVDGSGHASTTAYDLLGRAVVLTDPLGRVERRSYDGRGNVTEVRREAGGVLQRTLSTTYDGLGRTLSISESAAAETGNVVYTTQTVHDDVAHVTWTQNARGLLQASHLDGLGRVFKVVEDAPTGPLPRQPDDARIGPALALTSTVEYDAFSRVAARVDALGRRTETVHDALGRQVAVHHPMGVSTSKVYDGEGNLIQSVDGRGITRRFTYDALGRPRNEVLVESLSQGGQSLVVGQRAYIDVPDAEALTREEVLDARGNLTTLYRDGLGREVRRIDALGYVTKFRFDALHKRQTQDAKGYIARFSYDGAGRVLGQSDYASAGSSPTYSQTWEYADAVREQTHLNRRGVPTVLLHDGLGRKTRSVRGQGADVAEESWEYNASGHPIRFVDANGHAAERLYDGAGRLIEELLAAGSLDEAKTTFQYDAAGQLTQTKGPRVTGSVFDFRYTYDDLGRRVREENALNQVTAWAYDAVGNKVCAKQPLGQPSLAHGAASGMSLAQLEANACGGTYVTRFGYEEEGRLVSVTDAANGLYSYVYDAARNMVAKQDANENLTTYEYDVRNLRSAEHQHLDAHSRLTSAQRDSVPLFESGATPTSNTGTLTWRHTYDGNRNEASRVDPKGQRVEFAHGLLDRLASRTYSQHATPREFPSVDSEVLTYDPNGNLTGESQSKQTTNGVRQEVVTSTFDALDRLKTRLREYDGKQVSYRYDALGSRTRVEDSDAVATTYMYDALGRLTHATLPEGVVEYRYWPDSLLKGVTWPNGISEGRCYDAAGRLSQIVVGKGGVNDLCQSIVAMVSRHAYSYDGNGNRLVQIAVRTSPSTQELGSPEFTEYGYDVLNRLTGVKAPDGQASLYRWDAVGNRTGERRAPSLAVSGLGPDSYNTVLAHEVTYDVVGIFNRVDWLRNLRDLKDATKHVSLGYDLAGNITQKTVQASTRAFVWDVRNTLTAVYDNGVEVGRYDYDANLQRTMRHTAAGNVEYVLDGAFVLQEADGSQIHRPTQRRYHYGEGPIAVSEAPSASLSFLGMDALGSVTDVLNVIGQVTAAREYDAWGNYRSGSAPSVSDFKLGFTGHQYDVETGLTYARARYYDSDLGRFISRDSYEGKSDDAPSLHRYAYAYANPLRYSDPTGHCVNFFASDMVSWGNCVESGQVLAGYGVGVAKVFGGVGVLTYNATGALVYAATGESQYQAQAEAFSQGTEGLLHSVRSPGAFSQSSWDGLTGGLAQMGDAIDRGDLYGAGEGLGNFTAQAALLHEVGRGASANISRLPATAAAGVSVGLGNSGRVLAVTGPTHPTLGLAVFANAANGNGRSGARERTVTEARDKPGTAAVGRPKKDAPGPRSDSVKPPKGAEGKAIIRKYLNHNDSPHFSVEVHPSIGTRIETHQTMSRSGRSTWVNEIDDVARDQLRTPAEVREVSLADAFAAQHKQLEQLGAGDMGRWAPTGSSANACTTAVCDVLRAGGVDVPGPTGAQEYLYGMFGIPMKGAPR